jgi:hypothetical protein
MAETIFDKEAKKLLGASELRREYLGEETVKPQAFLSNSVDVGVVRISGIRLSSETQPIVEVMHANPSLYTAGAEQAELREDVNVKSVLQAMKVLFGRLHELTTECEVDHRPIELADDGTCSITFAAPKLYQKMVTAGLQVDNASRSTEAPGRTVRGEGRQDAMLIPRVTKELVL